MPRGSPESIALFTLSIDSTLRSHLQIVYPKLTNILHLLSIWVKFIGGWGKIATMKWVVSFNITQRQKFSPFTTDLQILHGYICDISQLMCLVEWPI